MTPTERRSDILVLADILPYPPVDGGKQCVFGLIDNLRQHHNFQIILNAYSDNDTKNIMALRSVWPDVNVHYIESFDRDAIARKPTTAEFIAQKFRNLIHKLTTSKTKAVTVADPYERYESTFSFPFYGHSRRYINKLTEVLAATKFDIVQTEFTRMLNLVNLLPADAKKVFVQIESRGSVLYDHARANNFDEAYTNHVAGNAEFLEYAYMKQYDAVLALNDSDRSVIRENLPASVKVYTSPFGVLDADIREPDLSRYIPENLIFIGGEGHYPNADALDWFLTDIVPLFKGQLPFNKLYVTGWWSPQTRNKHTERHSFVEFTGFVDDLAPYLKNSVSIVPIRIGGGGIRSKILSAMAQGVPVISTAMAAVGINANNGTEIMISDTAEGFEQMISALFNDLNRAKELAARAFALIRDHYSQTSAGAVRNKIYQELCQNEGLSSK